MFQARGGREQVVRPGLLAEDDQIMRVTEGDETMRGEIIHGRHHDEVPHTVLSPDKKTIVSPALDADEKFPHTFTVAGRTLMTIARCIPA